MNEPDKIVFVNKYYPKGITKRQLADYYIANKNRILKECGNRPIVLFMSFEAYNPLVVQRKVDNKQIVFNSKNYDKLMTTGNILSVAAEIPRRTNFWVIDIDCKTVSDNRKKVKAVDDVLKTMEGFVKTFRVCNSTTGFHVYGYLSKNVDKTSQKILIERQLENHLSHIYKIGNLQEIESLNVTRREINLDLSPMNERGAILVPGSLTREGIICSDITRNYTTWDVRKSLI